MTNLEWTKDFELGGGTSIGGGIGLAQTVTAWIFVGLLEEIQPITQAMSTIKYNIFFHQNWDFLEQVWYDLTGPLDRHRPCSWYNSWLGVMLGLIVLTNSQFPC